MKIANPLLSMEPRIKVSGVGTTYYYNSEVVVIYLNKYIENTQNGDETSFQTGHGVIPIQDIPMHLPTMSAGWIPDGGTAYISWNSNGKVHCRFSQTGKGAQIFGCFAFPRFMFTDNY